MICSIKIIQCPELPNERPPVLTNEGICADLRALQRFYPSVFSVLGHEQKMQMILDELKQHGDARSTYLRPPTEPLIMSTWSTNVHPQNLHQANSLASIILCKKAEGRTPEMQGIAEHGGRVKFESIEKSSTWIKDIIRVDQTERTPLEKAAYRFMRTISAHPFRDGNGRIARALIYGPFAAANILTLPILGITPIFDIHRLELSRRVIKLSDDADWSDFLEYFEFLITECIQISRLVAERNLQIQKAEE
jgi:hypothetical protein